MVKRGAPPLKLAVLASKELDRESLLTLEREEGLIVVHQGSCDEMHADQLSDADVVLIELGQETQRECVTRLLECAQKPVLLHTGPVNSKALLDTKLIGQLRELVEQPHLMRRLERDRRRNAERAWAVALCGSVGGPNAIGRFLSAIPESLGVIFIIVQHMAKDFQSLFAAQLSRVTGLRTRVIGAGDRLDAGTVWIVPADGRIALDGDRAEIVNSRWSGPNRPCINDVLTLLARHYGKHCGAILFSGVGTDGLQGSEVVNREGGFVWAQNAASCVVAGLPDAARAAGMVELSDTPEGMAAAVYRRCTREGLTPS